jgi:RTX calcium-binding nonapeptide repeat (4 copies)
MARCLLLFLLIGLIVPAAASAGTVNGFPNSPPQSEDQLRFTAAPGEANSVSVQVEGPGSTFYDIVDTGAPLSATGSCLSVDAHSARCNLGVPFNAILLADLGDGDDSLTVGAGFGFGTLAGGGPGNDSIAGACQVNGNDGNDTLVLCDNAGAFGDGGRGDDTIRAGSGGDTLAGRAGRDHLIGGTGDDSFLEGVPDGPGPDAIEGGPGSDTLFYGVSTKGVTIDLAKQAIDEPGVPGDTISGIENVTTQRGANTLIGDAGPNKLAGGTGPDKIFGAGGNDQLQGGLGPDTIDGGTGDDLIYARDLWRDHVRCGGGSDNEQVERGDVLAGDCRHPVRKPLRMVFQKRLQEQPNGTMRVAVGCANTELLPALAQLFPSCIGRVTIELRINRHWVMAGSASCASLSNCPDIFTVKLRRGPRRALARAVRLTGRLSYSPSPHHAAAALRERLRLPARRARPKH